MADLEKVIKGVHDARRYLEDREWVNKSVGVHIDALNDALELLKYQQAEIERLREMQLVDSCEKCRFKDKCLTGIQLSR